MRVFVVRLNPDTRQGVPYSKYPTVEEYENIHSSSPMDGFHEAVNFKSENGVIRGYLPPKHAKSLRDGEEFALITITAKTATEGGDLIVGVQSGCRYFGQTPRVGNRNIESLDLHWHYTCPESLSLILDRPISNARNLVLGKNGKWVRGPTYSPAQEDIKKIAAKIKKACISEKSQRKAKLILSAISSRKLVIKKELEVQSKFDDEVKKALESKLDNVKGNKTPEQKEQIAYRYQRDPKVVAFVLKSAKGVCHDCKKKGPFVSKVTGLPFLEVHHVVMLKDGGEDTVENSIAICPNCHRKRHFG